jgi:DNA-binding response OmpR family regulator
MEASKAMTNKVDPTSPSSVLSDALMALCHKADLEVAIEAIEVSHAALCEKAGRIAALTSSEIISFKDGLDIDFKLKKISRKDAPIYLCPSEWAILGAIIAKAGAPASPEYLAQTLYPDQPRKSNVIEVYVSKLRAKIGRDAIFTMRGIGYILA